MLTTAVSLIIVLGVLIFVHELGHFLAAKAAGVHVHRFSLGLGAPIRWLTFTRNGTEYSISWLPLGGYVKMASQEEEVTSSALEGGSAEAPVPIEQTFEAKPVWKRMVIILAGVVMNMLFAWLLYSWLALDNGRQVDPTVTVGEVVAEAIPPGAEQLAQLETGDRISDVNGVPITSWNGFVERLQTAPEPQLTITTEAGKQVVLDVHADALEQRLPLAFAVLPFREPVVGLLVAGKPAERTGVQVGDTIISAGGRAVTQWYELLDILADRRTEPLELVLGRAGGRTTLVVQPELEEIQLPDGTTEQAARIGIGPEARFESEPYTLGGAVVAGWEATEGTVLQIWRSVRGLVTGRISGRNLGGPILIGQMAGQTARMGLDAFLSFMALISVNLAILNMLPIPVLDGGQFLFLVAEGVTRRPLPLKLRERLTMVGMVLIVMLMVFAFSNDIMRVVGR